MKYLKIKKDYFCESLRRKHHLILSVGFLLPLDTLADLFIYNVKHQKNKQEPKCSLGKLDKILLVASIFLLCYMRCDSNKSWIISYGSSETVGYGRIMALASCRDKWFRFYWGFPGHPSVKLADFERMSKLSLRDFFFFFFRYSHSRQHCIACYGTSVILLIALFIYVYWIGTGCKI